MYVTIFGGSKVLPGEKDYQDAEWLGKELATNGYIVLTGGYVGTMEAVSKGAFNAGGHVIGVTCEEIEKWRNVKVNPWVKEQRHYATLHERMLALINSCDVSITLSGGVGTLAEVALIWNRTLIGAIKPHPIILVGEAWKQTIQTFFNQQGQYINDHEKSFITLVEDVQSAVNIVQLQAGIKK